MNWIKRLLPRDYDDQELDRELQFHLDQLQQENLANGMSPDEARRQAVLEFGGPQQCREDLRDVYRIRVLDALRRNLRFAFRLIRKSPAFSAAVILTLTLGIGANSAVFSAIDAILLRPLPFPQGDQLMLLQQQSDQTRSPQGLVAPVRLEDWNRMNSSFQAISGYYIEDASETSAELPERLSRAFVAPRFLQVLGVAPILGRDFTPAEAKLGGPNALLISDRLWHRRFNRDPNIVGKKLRFGQSSPTIVGVLPASFRFPNRDVDIWSPVATDAPYAQKREATWYTTIGRLKPGVSALRARADLTVVQSQLAVQFPQTDKLDINIQPLKENAVASSRRSLWILFAAVTVLLLIACTNIAALLLARTTERAHEISVRFSLGASRSTVISQLFTEVFVLALFGALAGLGLAAAATRALRAFAHSLPRVDEVTLDWRIVSYVLFCSVMVTLLCGVIPAMRATRSELAGSLATGSRTQVSTRHPMQWTLVGIQVMLAVTLLSGAGLLLRSFQELARVSPGFDSTHVLTLHISGSWHETADMKALKQRIDTTIEALRALPGVEAAATSDTLPGVPNQFPADVKILEGESDPNRKFAADARFVSQGYFATMKIPVLAGEPCRQSPPNYEVVVNRAFVSMVFGDREAIGHHVQSALSSQSQLAGEIRGIVGDAREQGINSAPGPLVYWCISAPTPDPFFLIRTRTEPLAMTETVRHAIHEIEPSRAVFDISSLEDQLDNAFAENRMRTILLSFFAFTAVSLACIGLYGTLGYLVNLRRREVGLRLALGARRDQIATHFLVRGLRVCIVGCLLGLLLAAASGRLLDGMLFGVSANDPPTIISVVALILVVSLLASLLPALRASRTDPMNVLREG